MRPKQGMTSFDIAAIVNELNHVLCDCRVNNIYQTSPLTFLFTLQSDRQLLIESGRRIHLTQYQVTRPQTPSHFCRLLRKYLRRGRIQAIEMPHFERIVLITIAAHQTMYKLVVELFGKGNVILLDATDTILYASSYRKMRDRDVLRKTPFVLPPPRGLDPTQITRQDLDTLPHTEGTVVQAVSRRLSLGGQYAEELVHRAAIDRQTRANELTTRDIDAIYTEITTLITTLFTETAPRLVAGSDGTPIDMTPIPLQLYREYPYTPYSTFNAAADDYFTKQTHETRQQDREDDAQHLIAEQQRILAQQQESLHAFEKTAITHQQIGDLIYGHTTTLEALIHILRDIVKQNIGAEQQLVEAQTRETTLLHTQLLQQLHPQEGRFTVTIDGVTFDLSFRMSVYENASRYYEDAKRAKMKLEGVKTSIAQTQKRIQRLERRGVQTAQTEERPQHRRRRRWYEKFHWTHSRDGYLIVGGRDASTNELLIKRHTNNDDIILHAELPGAPFVVIKTSGKTPPPETLNEAAQCAVSYSKAWRGGYSSLDAYWITPDQVSKEAPSGEYLTRGAFMIYGQKHYLRNVALQIAVGVTQHDADWIVIGGPPSAIAAQTKFFIEVRPGRQSSGRLAKEIRQRLSKMVPEPETRAILRLSLDEIQRFIPAGGSDLV